MENKGQTNRNVVLKTDLIL